MNWQEILTAVLVAVVGIALPPLSFMLLNWLKSQKWVQKAHLEGFFSAMVPQVVQWVEYWAENIVKEGGKAPTPVQKMGKFRELLKKELPAKSNMTDDQLALRAEAELRKLKGAAGLNGG